ncbi:MAG TPA: serine/threonine-protein kinase [Vicinamibacterales bacterium]|nr:serine/threonine-protein kinase [Vicinamibacterales bacterium]
MTPERFEAVKRVLMAVIALPPDERSGGLDRECAGDPALRDEVAALMTDDLPSVVQTGGLARRVETLAAAPEPAGRQVGRYRILGVLGEGGMGIVYRAEQTAPIRREVALKLVAPGWDSARVVARFASERQTLARMNHPCIAQVFDAGSAEDGRPFFAMELVEGEPITEYCSREQPPIEVRLQLFLQICDAVRHAHQRGIIHRDLKPSNILLTRQGTDLVPKVIDFGIAKAIAGADAERLVTTADGQIIGTLEYMSPEQAGVIDAEVDTRSDVYALGIVLYELLSGSRPYTLRRRTALELEKATRTPPAPPSQAGRANGARRLSGQSDLDAVALMAVERLPDDRYASVEQLADDVRNVIGQRPVRARTHTWTYRTQKFVRRHAVIVAAASLAAALVMAGSLAIVSQRNRAVASEARAVAEAAIARAEAEKATAVSQFLTNLFQASNPANALGANATARDLLARGERRLATDLGSQEAVRATLMDVIGVVYQQLGMIDESERITRESLAVRRRVFGDVHADVATTLDNLGQLMRYRTRYAEAVPMHHEALRIRRAVFGPRHAAPANSLNNLGLALLQWGRPHEAAPFIREGLEIRMEQLGPEHVDTTVSMSNLGDVLEDLGQYEEAARWYRRAIDVRQRTLAPNHPRQALVLAKLSSLLLTEGKFQEAESLARRVLAIRLEIYDADHPDIALAKNQLASLLLEMDRVDEAETLVREALDPIRRRYGERHMELANCLLNLGSVSEARGNLRDGRTFYEQARAMTIELQGQEHESVATALTSLGRVHYVQGALADAERDLRRAIEIREALRLQRTPRHAAALMWLGRVKKDGGRLDEAKADFEAALAIDRGLLPSGSAGTAATLIALGGLMTHDQQPSAAEPLLRDALAWRQANLPIEHRAIGEARAALGEALLGQEKYGEAESLLSSALESVPAGVTPLAYNRATVRELIGRLHDASGQPRKAAYRPPGSPR